MLHAPFVGPNDEASLKLEYWPAKYWSAGNAPTHRGPVKMSSVTEQNHALTPVGNIQTVTD